MKHSIRRFILNFEKEEKWLNKMAAKGLNFIYYSFPGRYLFEEGKPGEYIYRLELLDKLPKHYESRSYINFVEETGAELVATYFRWAWFRKKASDGPFELYSDFSSKLVHYRKAKLFVAIGGLLNLYAGVFNLVYGLCHSVYPNVFLSPLSLAIATACGIVFYRYAKVTAGLKREKLLRE